jgi:hypothetical protein
MRLAIISSIFAFLAISASPKFKDFGEANFFESIKEITKREKRNIGSELLLKKINTDNSGTLTYKHTFYSKEKYHLVEYHFIKKSFCKGIKKTYYSESLINKDSAIVKFQKIQQAYEEAYGKKINSVKDSLFQKSTFTIINNKKYNNLYTLYLTKEGNIYVPIEVVIPLIE